MDSHHGISDSSKEFRVVAECNLTLGSAKNILAYIREQLEYTDEIELWTVNEFTADDLVEIANLPITTLPLKHIRK